MSTLASSLQTMHLVESLAVALYHWPQARLRRQNPSLYEAFIDFEKGERRHRTLFFEGLAAESAEPLFFAAALSVIVGVFASMLSLLFGFKALLYFEIAIEYVAIWHYGKILQRGLPEPWQSKVSEVREDERHHLQQMQQWLTKL